MRKIATALIITGALFLGGCAQVEEVAQPRQVSQEEFKSALDRTPSTYNDFDEVTRYLYGFYFEEGVAFNVIAGQYDDGTNRIFLLTTYEGEDWIFFDSMDIRSEEETVSLFSDLQSFDKFTDVQDGVSEEYIMELGAKEIDLLLSLTSESKFRLAGDAGSVERAFLDRELMLLTRVIHIYLGLEQGLTP